MAPTIASKKEILTPKVKRSPTASGIQVNATSDLPRGVKLTGAEKLHKDGLTGKGVKVAVIDSGVDADHPGFNNMVKHQMWFRDGSSLAEDDHGTHVAGTIHMMAPDAEIYDYRVFGAQGWDVDEAIVTSIYEAIFDGCHVINMSLGGRWASSNIRSAVQYAYDKGVIVVCAAGNEGDDDPLTNERSFPALWDEAICVAAVSKKDGKPTYFSNTNPQVDYSGVGLDITSFKPGGGFQTMSGTSMACPHVCGLIAALLSGNELPVFQQVAKGQIGRQIAKGLSLSKDSVLRELLNRKYLIDIGIKDGHDNSTGLGFLTYLSEDEFKRAGF